MSQADGGPAETKPAENRPAAVSTAPDMRPFVEVAVPVPLRQLFTYRVPEPLLGRLPVGTRVAVPFHRRKLAAFVVGHRAHPPEGVSRIMKVAGALEREPVFPEELLKFLQEAARYYLHPFGEVLRAAAPAVPTGALRRLRKEGFLDSKEALPGKSVAHRKETFVHAAQVEDSKGQRLGSAQTELLAIIQERKTVTLTELRVRSQRARAVVRRLEELQLVTTEEKEVLADPFFGSAMERDEPPMLHDAQRLAVDRIVSAIEGRSTESFLLHGVTGSGKTEVYLHAIAEARARGRGALLLVPEIALTPQLVGRFRARFGDAIAVLHSGLKDKARDEAWRRLRTGEVNLAVGARSALFAPVHDLGIIVVDEEHDPSYKQEEGFRYNARDMALLRAHRCNAVCVLGSATPSMESFHRAQSNKSTLLSLPVRAAGREMPKVELVDLRRHRPGSGGHALLSGPLDRAIRDAIDAGEQAILFLNRRGFAPNVRCMACGEMVECPSCSVALTEHRAARQLRCHYCDFHVAIGQPPSARPVGRGSAAHRPESEDERGGLAGLADGRCPKCSQKALESFGLGTEQLEDTLAAAFAPARVARLDRDVASGKTVEQVLDRLRRREVDLLVGTQMVTKGHDLPGVTVVGVVMADQPLGFPDFRAPERTFQLLAQVAGRAGRGDRPGRVYFQTFQEHPAISAAANHDYETFYRAERAAREELAYPPYGWMTAVRLDALDEARGALAAERLANAVRQHPAVRELRVMVQGPAPAPITRLRSRWRFRFLLRSEDRRALRDVSAFVAQRIDEGDAKPARASVDVDPVSML